MKETYSMKEVVFMYLKASSKKKEWETFRTLETVPTDEFRTEYKRLMSVMKRIVYMFADSKECAEVIEDKNFSVRKEDVRDVTRLFYHYDTDAIWREIEKLLPLYDGDKESREKLKNHRGTERSKAAKRFECLKKGSKRSFEDFKSELEDALKISLEDQSEDQKDIDIKKDKKKGKGCKYDVDIMYHEICETADILERIFQDRVEGIAELLDNASGRNFLVRKGTWNIIE